MAPSQLPAGSSTVLSKNGIVMMSLIAVVLFSWTAVFFVKRSRSSAQQVDNKIATDVPVPSTSRRLLQSVRGVFSYGHEVVTDVEACPQPLLQATRTICSQDSSVQASFLQSFNAPMKNAQAMASASQAISDKETSMHASFLKSSRDSIKTKSFKESPSVSSALHQHDLAVALATSPIRVLFSISECEEYDESEENQATASMEADVSVLQESIVESPAQSGIAKIGEESLAPEEAVVLMPLAPSPYRPLYSIEECEEYVQVEEAPAELIKRESRAVIVNVHDFTSESLEGSAPFYVLSRPSVQAYCVPIDDVLTILGVPTITVTDYTWTPPAGLLASRRAPKVPAAVASDDIFSASTKHNISWKIPASPSSPAKKRSFKSSSESNKENETGMEIVHGVPKTPRRRDVVELKSCWSP